MGRSDEELVEACQAGEASAFDVLVARWEDRIRGAAYRFLGSEEEARDVARVVRRAVDALPDEQREVVILKEYQELTFLEIAQALDVPVSTVKTRLYRGLGQLRLRLAREGVRGAAPVPAPAR
jgi:DNA-directed RNA polymerase specialized sigma24 family protein